MEELFVTSLISRCYVLYDLPVAEIARAARGIKVGAVNRRGVGIADFGDVLSIFVELLFFTGLSFPLDSRFVIIIPTDSSLSLLYSFSPFSFCNRLKRALGFRTDLGCVSVKFGGLGCSSHELLQLQN